MKAVITVQMDNAAFDPHGSELARILTDLAVRIEGRATVAGQNLSLRDYNGNIVGQLEVSA